MRPNVRSLLSRLAPWILLVLCVLAALWQARTVSAKWAEDKVRLEHSDSVVAQLVDIMSDQSRRIARLQEDSAQLAAEGAVARAEFAREYARWQTLVRTAATPRVDTVTLEPLVPVNVDEVIRQAGATIESCLTNVANCEERAVNAEQRRAAVDSMFRLAELRSRQHEQQATIWRRRAQPSLWEQLKQLPARAVTTSAIVGTTYLACKTGVLP